MESVVLTRGTTEWRNRRPAPTGRNAKDQGGAREELPQVRIGVQPQGGEMRKLRAKP
jgi:hypothetical protein